MNNEAIHIRLEHSEAISGKRDLLTSQESLIKISKSINNYIPSRIEELSEREKIMKKILELKRNLNKLEKNLPKIKIPRALRKKIKENIQNNEPTKQLQKEIKNISLEEELEEIQRKLKQIGN